MTVLSRSSDVPDAARSVQLPGGGIASYETYGDPEGPCLFVLHGLPGSRAQAPSFWPDRPLDFHVVAIDRPGYGSSTPQPRPSLRQSADVVRRVADALGVQKFHVLGVSGGGPFALACAHELPDRVIAVAVVCGAIRPLGWRGSLASAGARVLHRMPRLVEPLLWTATLRARASRIRGSRLHAEDVAVAADPRYATLQQASRQLAFAQGRAGVVSDLRLIYGLWDLDLPRIRVPVLLWHGTEDPKIPLESVRQLARVLPRCELTEVPDRGHLLLPALWPDVVRGLLQQATGGGQSGASVDACPR